MLIHASGAVVVLVWIITGCRQLVRLTRKAHRITSGPLHERLALLCKRLDLKDEVDLLISPDEIPPVAFWFLRLKVMTPKALVDRLRSDELDAVLAHELVHHRRNDWAANWLELLVCAAWWFNPFAWLLSRVIADVREECCDDALVGSGLADPQVYCRTLVYSAEHLRGPPPVGTTLGFAEKPHPIAGRMRRITNPAVKHAPKLSNAGLVVMTILALTVLPGLRSRPAGSIIGPSPSPLPDELALVVVDAQTGQPLSDASLRFSRDQLPGNGKTDSKGRFLIPYNAALHKYIGITAEAPGHVPTHIHFVDPNSVPEAATLPLPRAVPIGGVIRNEEGEPIEGVEVHLRVAAGHDLTREGPSTAGIDDHVAITDAQGRWRSDTMPPNLANLVVQLVHPDYVSDATFRAFHERPPPNEDQLRELDSELIMYSGTELRGTVVGEAGAPIDGATITVDAFKTLAVNQVSTDPEGVFSFEKVRTGAVGVTAEADGYAPQHRAIQTSRETSPLQFRLTKGAEAVVRVVDTRGEPVEGASVRLQEWRGGGPISRDTKTDDEGYARLINLPQGELYLSIAKVPDYRTMPDYRWVPAQGEHVVTLHPALTVRGKVTDEAGVPVTRFHVTPGRAPEESGLPEWEQAGAREFRDGEYEVQLSQPHFSHYLRITAEGYEPAISGVLRPDEENATFDAYLKRSPEPGSPVAGTVLGSDGHPAAGVEVVMALPGKPVSLRQGRIVNSFAVPHTQADASGRFRFPPQAEDYLLVVADDRGYAEAPAEEFKKSQTINLQAWARIEGTMVLRGRPAHNEIAYGIPSQLRQLHVPRVLPFHIATTDSRGSFVLDRVSPGPFFVGRRFLYDEDGQSSRSDASHMAGYHVAPGETLRVQVAGTGWPVTGRVTAEAAALIVWSASAANLELKTDEPKAPAFSRPSNWYTISAAERLAWRDRYHASPAYHQFLREWVEWNARKRSYPFKIDASGAFRIDDVPPGLYTLTINAYAPNAVGYPDTRRPLGTLKLEVTIDPTGAAYSDAAQDLGSLVFKVDPVPSPGEAAPAFEGPTILDNPFKLTEALGKYVLLHFYSSTSDACNAEVPYLRSVYGRYATHERFTMIALSADSNHNHTFAYLDRHEADWPQMWRTAAKDPAVWDKYRLTRLPSTWLIGPDGLVIARDLRGTAIIDAIENALSRTGATPAPPVRETSPPAGSTPAASDKPL